MSSAEAYQLMRAGRLAEALPLAERAVAGKSICLPEHGLLATILMQLGRPSEADAVISAALQYAPGVADAYDALAFVSMHLGRHERANELYRRTVQLAPNNPTFWYNLASSERSFGRLSEAQAACDRAIALDATQYPSYLLRAELQVQTPEANHIAELQKLLARPGLEDRGRVFLGYAIAKELEDLQRFDEAFHWFREAASTRRRHLSYDIAVDERKLRRIAEAFPLEDVRRVAPSGDSNRYVFIMGLPRSGTTLLERILTGLPGVRSNGETDHFARALISASPPASAADDQAGADIFQRAAAADPLVVAANYAKLADPDACSGPGGRIVEKMPMNYLYLGAIHRALPEATLLLLRRSPLDSCFAMYRTLFGVAYPFSYDFDELARYYAAYERLIDHWRAALRDELYEVVYEDLVKEPQRIGSAIASACALPWNDAAVEVQKNASVSLTASAAQVRRPIYGSSSGRWRHYRKHLTPLIQALRRHGVAIPDDAASAT